MANITLKFFARLKEETGTSELIISLDELKSLAELKQHLLVTYPQWQVFLSKNLLTAVNQNMVSTDVNLVDGDEVAFFPPVTGG